MIVMDSLWRKFKEVPKRKKQALYALVSGLVLFGALCAVTIFVSEPLCPVKRWLGIRCPGCGLTRGFVAILRGNFVEAVRYHVLSLPLFVGAVGYTVCSISDILLDRNDLERIERQFGKPYMIAVYTLILVVAMWINMWRN